MLQNVWQDVRYGFRGLVTRPGFTLIAIADAGARHRQRGRDFQRHPERAARSGPVRGRRANRVRPDSRCEPQRAWWPHRLSGARVPRLPGTEPGVRRRHRRRLRRRPADDQGRHAAVCSAASSRRTPSGFSVCRRSSVAASSIPTSQPGAPPVFVMSHKMWVAQYSMDPGVVGRTFVLNGVPTTCVGVMPPRFTKQGADLWKPMKLDRADPAQQRRYIVFQAKLKRGCHVRAGDRGDGSRRAPDREALSRQLPAEVHRARRELGRRPRAAVPDDAVHAVCGGRRAAAHRVHQRRQHAARARRRARKGDGDSHVARSRPLAARASAAHREPDARVRRRGARVCLRVRGHLRA